MYNRNFRGNSQKKPRQQRTWQTNKPQDGRLSERSVRSDERQTSETARPARGGRRPFRQARSEQAGRPTFEAGRSERDGRKPFGQARPERGGRRPFGQNRPPQASGGRKRFSGQFIDYRKFINRAEPIIPVEAHIAKINFVDFKIDERLKKIITGRGYEQPTPIQEKTIPHILDSKDVVGLANTGTGKTGAFLIPLIDKILKNPKEKVLIVVPTRELAIQIQDEFAAFTKGLRLNSVSVVGGASIRPQIERLRSHHNIVIGTPGRLKDLIQRKNLHLDRFANIVLDEADRMLDMGFLPDVKFLMSLLAEKRQTLFFSATLAPEIEKLIAQFLNQPVKISLRSRETSVNVDQDVVHVKAGQDKIELLHDVLNKTKFQKVLIFARTKHGAEKLAKALHRRGFKVESIHGDKSHAKRQKALKLFRENIIDILVATDVAARGLDIPNVSHVFNFDVPGTYDDYIHRIGRTGRADKTGSALTFVG